jgi:hypothetical protein
MDNIQFTFEKTKVNSKKHKDFDTFLQNNFMCKTRKKFCAHCLTFFTHQQEKHNADHKKFTMTPGAFAKFDGFRK